MGNKHSRSNNNTTTTTMNNNHRELGRVSWSRDYDTSLQRAKEEEKPILLLFQEVPGCGTCVGYGQTALSNAAIVEATETLFVPVAVFNNKQGKDLEVLKKYGEPTWNNPVVRIITCDEKELCPRLAGDYSVEGLAHSMVTALKAIGSTPPHDLVALAAAK
eukprot:m.3180 g.3180  ORF g.3180 m.3180 type:complete len:161 (-) comp3296_c0_seq1:42-524(-)